jgi:hypothetical protein
MITMTSSHPSAASEYELRKQIDRSLSRALFDNEFASSLLADPTVVLDDQGCTPQQRRDLRTIRATSVLEFAQQARVLFWPSPDERYTHEEVALAAAAAM